MAQTRRQDFDCFNIQIKAILLLINIFVDIKSNQLLEYWLEGSAKNILFHNPWVESGVDWLVRSRHLLADIATVWIATDLKINIPEYIRRKMTSKDMEHYNKTS